MSLSTRYLSAAKKPPPKDGIKLGKAGTTWWGQRWIEALTQVLQGDSGRLRRGRSYARDGRTHDLVVHGNKVTAKVTGSRKTPYRITFTLRRLADAAWESAIAAMAAQARFSVELLNGQMPQEIDDVFHAAGTSLFPRDRKDLVTGCTCPDWCDPCKHVAAAHYVLGEALDRDPFLLFELRGRPQAAVLDALRAARAQAQPDPAIPKSKGKRKSKPDRTPPLAEDLAEIQAERPRVTLQLDTPSDYDRVREPFPALHMSFEVPKTHGALLRQLGSPPSWSGARSPTEMFVPLLREAAEMARCMVLAEPIASKPPAT